MLKRDELSNPNSCLNRAKDDEMIFVLLARDPAAPKVVREWCVERIQGYWNELDDAQITEAWECAKQMEAQRKQMEADQEKGKTVKSLIGRWVQCSMMQAINHAASRVVMGVDMRPEGLEFDYDCVMFTDGTAIACRSNWRGPLSKVTPDIDAESPIWQIFKPA